MSLRASFFLFLLVAHGCIVAAEHPTWQQLDARAKELYQQGKLKDAEAAMREAIPLAEKENGPVYDSVGGELNNLARILKAQKNYAEAERVLLRAAGMADKSLAEDDPDRLRSL